MTDAELLEQYRQKNKTTSETVDADAALLEQYRNNQYKTTTQTVKKKKNNPVSDTFNVIGNAAKSVSKGVQNLVSSQHRPKTNEDSIPADVRAYMMKVNTGHAQDPAPEPGKLSSEELEDQALLEQKRNIKAVSTIPADKIAPSKDKPKYPNATIGPAKAKDPNERPNLKSDIHEIKSFFGDPGLYVKNAVNKPIQQAKTVVSQVAGDVGKGLTLGALDLNEGKVFGQKVLPNNAEFLQSSGVSPDIASQETTGFKVGNVVPALKGTFFDWDIHPAEWAVMGPAIGAVSRGATKYISKPVGEFLYKKAPAVLKPLIPTLTRIFNSGLTGGTASTTSGLLQGQPLEKVPGNFGAGATFGSVFGIVGESLNTIARAPMARRANLYKQGVDKMAQWAYGEGRFNSYEEAFVAADKVFQQEVAARGGLGKLRPKDLNAFNQALAKMLEKQQRIVPPVETPPSIGAADSRVQNVAPDPVVPIVSVNGNSVVSVPESPQIALLSSGEGVSASQQNAGPNEILQQAGGEDNYFRSIAQNLEQQRQGGTNLAAFPEQMPVTKEPPDEFGDIPEFVQRIEEPNIGRATVDKPHGIYTNPADSESPHKDLGGDSFLWKTNPDCNILKVKTDMFESNRGLVGESAGVAAARHLFGDAYVSAMMQTPKDELANQLAAEYPDIDWTRYYDQQEMVEGYAGIKAREQGYDAIWAVDPHAPDANEFVGLTKKALTEVDDLPGKQPKTPTEPETSAEQANDALYNQVLTIHDDLISAEMDRIARERQGVEFVPSQNEPERKLRVSKNPAWYREFYKKHGRRPNKGELRDMAIERLTKGYESEEIGSIPPNDDFLEAQRILGELDRQRKPKVAAKPKQQPKKASGFADTGGYSDIEPEHQEGQEQSKEFIDKTDEQFEEKANPLAVEMPELLELFEKINDGKKPVLKENLNNALGRFQIRGKDGQIYLRRDIFTGERLEQFTLDRRQPVQSQIDAFTKRMEEKYGDNLVFKRQGKVVTCYHRNPNLAMKVLAHEIGHAVDWLDDKDIKRGNILGRIASLKKYCKHILPKRPGAPGELTQKDRERLRREAAKLAKQEKEAEENKTATSEPDKPTAADVLAIWNDVASREKNPDLYAYISRLSGKEKAQILKQALKGMVDLPGFDPAKKNETNYKDWSAREKEIYKDLVRDEVKKRRLFELENIIVELKALTQKWKPFDERVDPNYTKYRYSSVELYADAFSVLINNPKLLQKMAPNFYRAFFNYLENKPAVKAVYDEIQNRLGDKAAVLNKRLDEVYNDFTEGHVARKELNQRRKGKLESVKDTLARSLIDKNHPILKYVRRYEKEDSETGRLAQKLRDQIDETAYLSAKVYYYHHEIAEQVLKPLEDAGLDIDDLGTYLFFKRVINERADLANPHGYGEKTANETLDQLKERLGAERFEAVENAAKAFRKLREEIVIPHVMESRMFNKATIDMMKERKDYAKFSVQYYLSKTFGTGTTARIIQQVGTINIIENPFVATVLNDITLMRASKINESKLAAVAFLKDLAYTVSLSKKGEVSVAEKLIFPAKLVKNVAVEPKDPELALFDVMVDGEVHSYYISKEIADTFAREPVKANMITRIIGLLINPVKRLWVSYSPVWMVRNMFFRDPLATLKNNPEIRDLKSFFKWLHYSLEAIPEATRAVYKDELSPDLKKMFKGYMLNVNRIYDPDQKSSDNEIERIANEFDINVSSRKKVKNAWQRVLAAFKFLDSFGHVSELAPKLGGYKFMKNATNLSSPKIGQRVRNRIGTPNSRRKGTQHWWTDKLFVFANINKEGWRSTGEAFEDNPGVYIWKTVLFNVLPKLAMLGLSAGAMSKLGDKDNKWQKWAKAIPDYDKRNYMIVPWFFYPWMTKDGKAAYLRIPQDYEGQFFGALAHTLFKGKIFGKEGAANVVTEQTPWDIMNPNPYLSLSIDWAQYSLGGQNPIDEYRGQNIIPKKIFDAGGWEATERMGRYTWNSLGGSTLWTFGDDLTENAYQKMTKVFGLNVVGSFFKMSDRGNTEEYYEHKDQQTKEQAQKSLDLENRVKFAVKRSGRTPTIDDAEDLYDVLVKKGVIDEERSFGQFYRQQYLSYAGKAVRDTRLSMIMRARTNADRKELFDKARQELPRAAFDRLTKQLDGLEIYPDDYETDE
jgi:hypothetical protein